MSVLCMIFGHRWSAEGALAGKLICTRCNNLGSKDDYAKAI